MSAPLRYTPDKDDQDAPLMHSSIQDNDKLKEIRPYTELVKQGQLAAKATSKEKPKRRRLRGDNTFTPTSTRLGFPKRRSLLNQRRSKKERSGARLQMETPAANIQKQPGQPMVIASAAVLGGRATIEACGVGFGPSAFSAVKGNQSINIGYDAPVDPTGSEPIAARPGGVSVLDQGRARLLDSQVAPGSFNAVAGNINLNIKSVG